MLIWILTLVVAELIPFGMHYLGKLYLSGREMPKDHRFKCRIKGADKTDETWIFVHNLFGQMWYRAGFTMRMLVVIVMFIVVKQEPKAMMITCASVIVLELIMFFRSVYIVRKRLHIEFDENGIKHENSEELIQKNKDMYL